MTDDPQWMIHERGHEERPTVGREASPVLSQMRENGPRSIWPLLHEGDHVQIRLENRTIEGIVDCVTADGSIFWLWQDAGGGRMAVHEDDGATVSCLTLPSTAH